MTSNEKPLTPAQIKERDRVFALWEASRQKRHAIFKKRHALCTVSHPNRLATAAKGRQLASVFNNRYLLRLRRNYAHKLLYDQETPTSADTKPSEMIRKLQLAMPIKSPKATPEFVMDRNKYVPLQHSPIAKRHPASHVK